jgi:hypothetical protein
MAEASETSVDELRLAEVQDAWEWEEAAEAGTLLLPDRCVFSALAGSFALQPSDSRTMILPAGAGSAQRLRQATSSVQTRWPRWAARGCS